MTRMKPLIVLSLAAHAAAWVTCDYPEVDWMAVDIGLGKSATQKVAGLGTYAFIGGYATGNTTIMSSAGAEGSPTIEGDHDNDPDEMDMFLAMISDSGVPEKLWYMDGTGLGSAPGFGDMHGMRDGKHLAFALAVPKSATLKLPNGVLIEAPDDAAVSVAVKFDPFAASAGSEVVFYKIYHGSISGLDGDASGNLVVAHTICVPCTDADTCAPVLNPYTNQPTGALEPTCTQHITEYDGATGDETSDTVVDEDFSLGRIRVDNDGDYYMGSSVPAGKSVTFGSDTIASPEADKKAGVLLKYTSGGNPIMYAFAGGDKSAVGGFYFDVSADGTIIITAASLPDGAHVGDLVGSKQFGYFTSFIAAIDTDDGSVKWATATPMSRGAQITPDNKNVGVFAQSGSSEDELTLTDPNGATTTMRSRGSWDLIAILLDANDGSGQWAIDGGGDDMEYFHGFGMNGDGDMLISGYSRSSAFHFGDQMMPNPNAKGKGDGLNKIFTIQVSRGDAGTLAPCVESCANDEPVIEDGKCLIDHYCYSDGVNSFYPANECYSCDSSENSMKWTGPNLKEHCLIGGACVKDGAAKVNAGRPPTYSDCEACLVSKSTDSYSIRDLYDYVGDACVALPTVEPTQSDDLTTAMSASTDVKIITNKIPDSGDGEWTDAINAYNSSPLKALAIAKWPASEEWKKFAAFYGSETWIDEYIMSAMKGTGQFAGALSDDRGLMYAARKEGVKKGLQDQVLVMAAIATLDEDLKVEANWDMAYAYWVGDTPDGAPWARANKRCKNYDTCAADGKTAKANFKVLKAISDGKAGAKAGSDLAVEKAYVDFKAASLGVYFQAALRYAHLMDEDMVYGRASADHQGEGGAFFRVIEPYVSHIDPPLSNYVANFYDMTTVPTKGRKYYCPTAYALGNSMPVGFSATDMGTLTVAENVQCMSGMTLPTTVSSALDVAMNASAVVKMVTDAIGDMAKAEALYTGSVLHQIATSTEYEGTDMWDKYVSYFGSKTWMHDYIMSAFEATGQFKGELLPTTRGDMMAARTEAVKKGVQDQILFAAAVGELQKAGAAKKAETFYMSYAYHTGDDPTGGMWARANKRCKNYVTCGAGTNGQAHVNSEVLLSMLAAVEDPDTEGTTQAAKIISQYQIIYWQAALRYTNKLDKDVAGKTASADHQGEGGAFWRVIAPNFKDHEDGATVSKFYTMTTVPTGTDHFCTTRNMLYADLPTGTTQGDMGLLADTEDVTCTEPLPADGGMVSTSKVVVEGEVADWQPKAAEIEAATASALAYPVSQVAVKVLSGSAVLLFSITSGTKLEQETAEAMLTAMIGTTTAAESFLESVTGTPVTVSEVNMGIYPPSPPPPLNPSPKGDDDDDKPCFDSLTEVCRLVNTAASASEAYASCFGNGAAGAAERVAMHKLTSGDYVLSGEDKVDRVMVNQHKTANTKAPMLTISYDGGSLTVTPDHMLFIDGELAPARNALPGSSLDGNVVTSISPTAGVIVNPLTKSFHILAAGPGSVRAVLAATFPEWIAAELKASHAAAPLPLSALASYLAPQLAQDFSDGLLEQLSTTYLARAKNFVPQALLRATTVFADGGFAASFLVFASFKLMPSAVLLAAGGAALLSIRRAAKKA